MTSIKTRRGQSEKQQPGHTAYPNHHGCASLPLVTPSSKGPQIASQASHLLWDPPHTDSLLCNNGGRNRVSSSPCLVLKRLTRRKIGVEGQRRKWGSVHFVLSTLWGSFILQIFVLFSLINLVQVCVMLNLSPMLFYTLLLTPLFCLLKSFTSAFITYMCVYMYVCKCIMCAYTYVYVYDFMQLCVLSICVYIYMCVHVYGFVTLRKIQESQMRENLQNLSS